MLSTAALVAQVAINTSVTGSALTLIQGLAATQATLSAQLAAAIAAEDPVAIAAVQKALDDSATALGVSDSALAAAVAQNTPAQSLGPVGAPSSTVGQTPTP